MCKHDMLVIYFKADAQAGAGLAQVQGGEALVVVIFIN